MKANAIDMNGSYRNDDERLGAPGVYAGADILAQIAAFAGEVEGDEDWELEAVSVRSAAAAAANTNANQLALCDPCAWLERDRSAAAATLGSARTPRKAAASRENGKRGGRPPYRYAVTCYYDGPYGAKGTVLSKHTTHELAEAANRKHTGGFTGIGAL